MTTLAEYSRMCLAVAEEGREMQARSRTIHGDGAWRNFDPGRDYPGLADGLFEFRLKPRVGYIRMWGANLGVREGAWETFKKKPVNWQQRDDCLDMEREEE